MSQALAARGTDLQVICAARLRDCLDPQSGLFARQISAGRWAPTLGTESLTSSAICLIGLSRAGVPPGAVVDDPADLCGRIAAGIRNAGYAGGAGLLLWANSAVRAAAPLTLLAAAGLEPAGLERAIPTFTTMEVAWLASGLLHTDHPALGAACTAALQELERRLVCATLTFRHASAAAPLRHRLRSCIANFADQIYPLQALAFAAIARGEEWRGLADRCGARLVAVQGPLGQWWWHHDASTGRVIEGYPVYSVHQHSMAPMALRCLTAAGGQHHASAIARSRGWLQANELGLDLVEPATGVIWRSIERQEDGISRRLRQARMLFARAATEEVAPNLTLNREMRPYEWGWLLYATAIESGSAPFGHIV